MPKCIVTTSWDDGNKLDFKVMSLLKKYGLAGTFYVPQNYNSRLSDEEIKEIAQNQEIGAHTINHAVLTELSLDAAQKEISESKIWLENLIGQKVKMFCYPKGFFNNEIKKIVQEAGFLGARTTNDSSFENPRDLFEMETTVHIYPFPLRKRLAHEYHLSPYLFQPLQTKFFKLIKLNPPPSVYFSWLGLSKFLFDHALKVGGVYHLWGHSWEIERYDMWTDLEKLCQYISGRQDCLYLNNSQTIETTNK